MAINQKNYSHRGGGNYGVVLRLPNIVAEDRLVYFDHNRNRGTWVIRDFLDSQQLNNDHSGLNVAQIEADATHDEFPIWCNAEERPEDWTMYLKLRTTAVLMLERDLGPITRPNPHSGAWQRI